MAQEDYGLAIRDYTTAVKLYPAHLEAWNNLGNAYCRVGDYDAGLAGYNLVLAADPRYFEAYHNRAVAFFLKRDYDRAWQDVNKLQSLGYPVKPDFLSDLKRMSGRNE
jgi:tetratricopeptide (TPR) repeat protein